MEGSKMKIRCLKCNDVIESKHVHDFKKCKCGACFIDGGDNYTRVGGDFNYIHWVYEDGSEKELLNNKKA
jgi:hypothetical protein